MEKIVDSSIKKRPCISLVIPFFNEQENVANTLKAITDTITAQPYDYELVAVNDGSSDSTLDMLLGEYGKIFTLVVVDLSRNFGKEAALLAGLRYATGDAVIPLDADLQDPPVLISQLIAKWLEGFDVVLAKRQDRMNDNFIKRRTAAAFYKVINKFSEVAIPENVGDFRLMDRRVIDIINTLPETRLFMKGVFSWVGFRTTVVEYVRPKRTAGKTKFSTWKLWNLALEGITSFSIAPLKLWSYIGILVSMLAFLYGGFIIIKTFVFGIDLPGYASLISIILFMSGLNMLGLGMLGEYVGRIYIEAKRRPAFIVRSVERVAKKN